MSDSENPIVREEPGDDRGNPGRLDEFIARGCDVHFEAMGDAQFWMQVDMPDGRSWHINFGAKNPKAEGYAFVEVIDPSELRCSGFTYVSGGKEECGDDKFPDWSYRVRAECNQSPGGCGFSIPVPEEDGEPAWGLLNSDMDSLHAQHLAHSRGESR